MMDMRKGLYEVKIERMNMLLGDFQQTVKRIETKYVFVNDYEAFEKWLVGLYNECDVDRIKYEKVSETVIILK